MQLLAGCAAAGHQLLLLHLLLLPALHVYSFRGDFVQRVLFALLSPLL